MIAICLDRVMTSSLPSYDLARLFSHYNTRPGHSAGEALVEETNSSRELSSASEGDGRMMTDSLSTVSWEDINDDHEEYDHDGDDESRD